VSGDWQIKKLRDVCTLINGRAYSKSELLSEGKYPVLRVGNFFTNNNWYYSNFELPPEKYCGPGDLLYAWSASFGPRIWEGDKVIFHYHIWKVQPEVGLIDQRYLFYFFEWDTEQIKLDQGTGTTMIHVAKGSMEDRDVPVPSLPTQRRIVAILDEAFEGIVTAKANAEKNLQNAHELFDSHLEILLAHSGDGWLEVPIVECFKVRSGDFLPARSMASEGDIPVYGGNGIAGSHNASNLNGEQIIIGRVGAKCGNVRHVCGEIWLTDNAFHISKFMRPFDPAFLARVLNFKNLRQTANQAAQPVISYTTIKGVVLSFPTEIEEQRNIATQLDELEVHVEQVNAVHQRKLAALDELKKSLLHQAFSGQL
jgi:type I restriction enzyme, S subunit